MKSRLAILTNLLLFYGMSFGQQYEPFIKNSKEWTYVRAGSLTSGETTYWVESCYFKGDTIWNDTVYTKFYTKQVQPNIENERVSYLFHEDTFAKKVYVHDFHFNKTALLYDFSLNKGDSFNIYIVDNLYIKNKVLNVDTIITNNKKLKRIVFKDSTTWIESLGCVTKMYLPSEGELICVKEENSVLYLNSKFNSCDTIFSQGPINAIQEKTVTAPYFFTVYPNPIETNSKIRTESNTNQSFKIEIYNSLGTLVKKDRFVDHYPIGLIHLKRGLYVYRIKINNEIIKTNKLIVK